ncbi:Exocyst complex component S5 [Chamberlinius hualienensis]
MSAPSVTGISPKEGPPGTRVTIRGENLGNGPQDFIGLTICGADCLLSAEWIAPNKIIARSRLAKGRGDVIVTTKSGGRGTCTIQFHSLTETIGPLKETAVWIDESQFFGNASNRKRAIAPSFLNQDNPLGLSDEGNTKKFPEEELHEIFPDGSGNLSSEHFIPLWFLVDNHYGASFQDLQAGLNCLKRKVNTQKEGELSFLKANVGAVLDQLDTLKVLQTRILNDKATLGSVSTKEIESAVKSAKSEADLLFKDVLGRRDRAEATRNTLSVLQRFKFLFNLPCAIERNIQKGDYDIVINDYARVKSLFSDTEVAIFKKVYQEVEQRIANVRKMLMERLQDSPVELNQQLRLIRYLINLETPGDPAWDCIIFQKNCIVKSLEACKNSHLIQDKCDAETIHLKTKPVNGRSGSQAFLATRSGQRRGSQFSRGETWQEPPPHRVIFVEEICNTIVQEFSNLWKLGQCYLSGDLLAKEGAGGFQKLGANKGKEFMASMLNVVQSFCNQIRGALQEKWKPQEWSTTTVDAAKRCLPHCIQQIKNIYSSLNELNLPKDILNMVQQLLFDLRMDCLISMFTRAEEEVKNMHNRETWVIEYDLELGGITQLPLNYENIVLRTIQLVSEVVLQVGSHEKELLGNAAAEKVVVNHWRDLLLGFSFALKQLCKTVTLSTVDNKDQIKIHSSDAFSNRLNEKSTAGNENRDCNTSQIKLLLVVLGNCNYAKKHILPRLHESYQKHGFPNAESVEKDVLKNFENLDNSIFEMYCEHKCEPIVGGIEQRMSAGHFDWNKCAKVVGVRVYIKEILMELNSVYFEIHCVSEFVVQRAMKRIVESICEEIARLFACIENYSLAGGVQAWVDVKSLEAAFSDNLTESSRKSLKEALDSLPSIRGIKLEKSVDEEMKKFQQRMKFQLMCFNI